MLLNYLNMLLKAIVLLSFLLSTTLAQGSWSSVIDLPIVPVAAYIIPEAPEATRLMFFSSWSPTTFGGQRGITQFAEYNYRTGSVSQRQVSNTKHDMFCPGMSSLGDGRLVITGGSNAERTSIYDPATNAFTAGPDMQISRGYQSSTIVSSGKIFTIGGSWSGARGGKTGEIFDPLANTWTILPGADVNPMLTTTMKATSELTTTPGCSLGRMAQSSKRGPVRPCIGTIPAAQEVLRLPAYATE